MATARTSSWDDLVAGVEAVGGLNKLNLLFKTDQQFLAFSSTPAPVRPLVFRIASAAPDTSLLITVSPTGSTASAGAVGAGEAAFTLTAQPYQWQAFFTNQPTPPFHSYWGMRFTEAMAGTEAVKGDLDEFARFAHIWRRTLELLREAVCGPVLAEAEPGANNADASETAQDHIVGGYMNLAAPNWGQCKVYYEKSGTGDQDIVFLHTAGSDSRQLHAVMSSIILQQRYTMHVFDWPGHGRSLLGSKCVPGEYTATEDDFVGIVGAFVKGCQLDKPIICGASMAGNICLAVAIRNDAVGAGGVVPLQACEHIPAPRWAWDRSPYINSSLFNPESVYATMSPTTPMRNKHLLWQTYSAQMYGILAGDLDFYFGGWDGRGRVETIDTRTCPVFMLTGDHDFVNLPAYSEATAAKIPGAMFRTMPGLGHFPVVEKPAVFIPFLIEAVEHIAKMRVSA